MRPGKRANRLVLVGATIGGLLLTGGFILFMSTFLLFARSYTSFQTDSMVEPDLGVRRALFGMALMAAGTLFLRASLGFGLLGKARQISASMRGSAGEYQARRPLAPPLSTTTAALPAPGEIVRIRCLACKALNDEDAKFCKSCGGPL